MSFSRARSSSSARRASSAGRQAGQQGGELFLLGGRHGRQGIERREDEPLLVLGQLDVGHRDRGLVAGEGELDPEVTVDDVARSSG